MVKLSKIGLALAGFMYPCLSQGFWIEDASFYKPSSEQHYEGHSVKQEDSRLSLYYVFQKTDQKPLLINLESDTEWALLKAGARSAPKEYEQSARLAIIFSLDCRGVLLEKAKIREQLTFFYRGVLLNLNV